LKPETVMLSTLPLPLALLALVLEGALLSVVWALALPAAKTAIAHSAKTEPVVKNRLLRISTGAAPQFL
jgi:hypothetical protein